MSWFDNILGGAQDLFEGADLGGIAALLASAGYTSGALDPLLGGLGLGFLQSTSGGAPPVGYQGGIPSYTAVRQQVPATATPRPGDAGRRYFSDTIYAQGPQSDPPTVAQAQSQASQQAQGLAALNPGMAYGGEVKGMYLGGPTDGMADRVPARMSADREAALSDGEFVIPADVVSHLGNGNSNAGAQQLYAMMDRVRQARTGNKSQGRQIEPSRQMPV